MIGEQDEERGDALEGRYANYFEVGHNAFEFVLAFGQFYPSSSGPRLLTRVVTGPPYAKALTRTLMESLARYEATFGPIAEPPNDPPSR